MSEPVRRGELEQLRLRHSSGAVASVVTQGAHVVEWTPAVGTEALFLGETAEFARGRTIRGGVPIVFPQFAELGPLPKHGIVRTLEWSATERSDTAVTLQLASSSATRALWPHDFLLTVHVVLGANALSMRLHVQNTGRTPFGFTGGLHTYLRVSDIREIAVRGLHGHPYLDKTRGSGREIDDARELVVSGETDRVYEGTSEVQLSDAAVGRSLVVRASGFRNLVVWNPWYERVTEFSGLGPGDYRKFICIEPAVVSSPVQLEPGGTWTGTQELIAQPLA